jgi:hypothetical protein
MTFSTYVDHHWPTTAHPLKSTHQRWQPESITAHTPFIKCSPTFSLISPFQRHNLMKIRFSRHSGIYNECAGMQKTFLSHMREREIHLQAVLQSLPPLSECLRQSGERESLRHQPQSFRKFFALWNLNEEKSFPHLSDDPCKA